MIADNGSGGARAGTVQPKGATPPSGLPRPGARALFKIMVTHA
jgi:hypothetical protein